MDQNQPSSSHASVLSKFIMDPHTGKLKVNKQFYTQPHSKPMDTPLPTLRRLGAVGNFNSIKATPMRVPPINLGRSKQVVQSARQICVHDAVLEEDEDLQDTEHEDELDLKRPGNEYDFTDKFIDTDDIEEYVELTGQNSVQALETPTE